MQTNLLKPNDEETEFLLVGTKQQLSKITNINVKIGHNEIKPVSSIRNLGYHQDAEMKMLNMSINYANNFTQY